MIWSKIIEGTLTIEIKVIKMEKLLNMFWKKGIEISNAEKTDESTIKMEIKYKDYETAYEIVKHNKGKIKIVGKRGTLFKLLNLRKRISLVIGAVLFFLIMYGLSNYIWAIDITTKLNLSPFEVRRELASMGIKPGLKKSDINVYEIERNMQTMNSQIMWIRTRIEGSTLHLVIEEKIDPPSLEKEEPLSVVAKCDGEVQRIYTYTGNPAVAVGDIVKKGDVLINPVQGREGFEVETKPNGKIIANTFYEKYMEVQVSGEKLVRTGNKQKEIYVNVFGKKIYLKKAVKKFDNYDKMEETSGLIGTTEYFEKNAVPVNEDAEKVKEESAQKLEESLQKSLSNDAKIIKKDVTTEDTGEGKILVKVIFTVEQDIAQNIS